MQEQYTHFKKPAEQALNILLAQIGNARVRNMHSKKIKAYISFLHKRLEIMERNQVKECNRIGWDEVDDHYKALAKLWDEEDVKCPPHKHG
jgi:hypothetical protein